MTYSDRPTPIPNPQVAREDIRFSHPSEAEFARILDYYGINWRYEPTVFPIEWDEFGTVTVAFSPDFFLVDQDLYIELTTMRQKLTRIKRRKLRRLQELYPDVRVKLWNRASFVRLMGRYDMDDRAQAVVGQRGVDNASG